MKKVKFSIGIILIGASLGGALLLLIQIAMSPERLVSDQNLLARMQSLQLQISPKMILIPPGRFRMECMNAQRCHDTDSEASWIEIDSFLLMEHEVTWDMYQPCIDEGKCPDNSTAGGDKGWGKGNRPIINVNWFDITEHYIPWLNLNTGQTFRMPTEVEWEYAARAGSTTAYHWGEDIGVNQANCAGCGSQWDGKQTSPVKSFAPNDFGLYDIHGNVWEWTADCWNGAYGRGTSLGGIWVEKNCGQRVLRGGSFVELPLSVNITARGAKGTDQRGEYGIRLAQDLPQLGQILAR